MEHDIKRLDILQSAYKAAVEDWITAIRAEEALASVNHSVAEVDRWENAHFHEEDLRHLGDLESDRMSTLYPGNWPSRPSSETNSVT